MTVRAKLKDTAYIYAQALDHSGESDYWSTTEHGRFKKVRSDAPEAAAVRDFIDELQGCGRLWKIAGGSLDCRITWRGNCLVTIRPITRDASDRVSPVLISMNVFKKGRQFGMKALTDIQTIVSRELTEIDKCSITRFNKILNWPRWLVFLHITLFSRRALYD